MTVSKIIKAPPLRPGKANRSATADPTWLFVRVYSASLAVCILSLFFLPLLPLCYLFCGWYATRTVSTNVTWSPLEGTLANVAAAKWQLFIGWPWRFPPLIVDCLRARYL